MAMTEADVRYAIKLIEEGSDLKFLLTRHRVMKATISVDGSYARIDEKKFKEHCLEYFTQRLSDIENILGRMGVEI